MKHLFFSFIFICFSLVSMVSCNSRKPTEPVKVETNRTVIQTIRDTVYKVQPDSAFYQSYIDCRDGKPYIIKDSIRIVVGKTVKVPEVVLKNNYLKVDCRQDALNLFKSWKETYIRENQKTTVPQYVEKPFRWYHKVLMWCGAIALFLAVLGAVLKFIKPF